jgi:hypothetical protein
MPMIELPAGYIRVEAPCQDDPDRWFSDSDIDKASAKATCMSCPFKIACKKTAIENREKHGIWGGVDFSTYKLPKSTSNMCRKGKHQLPENRENNQCIECRKETQKAWEEKQAKQGTKRYKDRLKSNAERRKKNKIGELCRNGKHMLTENNTKVRPNDGALMCTDCLERVKIRSDSRSGHGRDLNMGSSNKAGMVNFRKLRRGK